MADRDRRSRWLVWVPLLVFFVAGLSANASAQHKQGLGPGGSRLTPPPAPAPSSTGFGPNTGFGSNTGFGPSTGFGGSSSGGTPPGTVCVSIQCADGTVVPCNSTCPHPGAPGPAAPGSGGPGGGSPPAQNAAWEAMLAANKRGLEAYRSRDYEAAARHFREALRYVPDEPTVRGNLEDAEAQMRREQERLAEQRREQQREAEARNAIRQGVERLAALLGTPPPASAGTAPGSGLDFLRSPTAEAPECVEGRARAANQDPTVVDLRCAGTLTVDPARVKGSPVAQPGGGLEFARSLDAPPMRDAPAPLPNPRPAGKEPGKIQVSEQTLTNANYQKGFDAIRAGDHTLAVAYFTKARAERGDDVLVKNALALAEDLARVHGQAGEKDQAAVQFRDGLAAAIHGDYDLAIRRLQAAVDLEPGNARYRDELSFVQGVRRGVSLERERMHDGEREAAAVETAEQLARMSFIPWRRGDRESALIILETAQALSPGSPEIEALLKIARGAR